MVVDRKVIQQVTKIERGDGRSPQVQRLRSIPVTEGKRLLVQRNLVINHDTGSVGIIGNARS